jgi:flavin reductase (DIM6/NTAB) family NADH-FMN oxidoreductase RutF
VALIAEVDGAPRGMLAASFTVGVSAEPPLVSCAIQRSSATWPVLRGSPSIGISVLAADQEHLARQIGSPDRSRRFAGVPLRDTGSTARFIAGSPVWLECTLHSEFPAGDHTVALLEVRGLGADPGLPPLVFHGSTFRRLLLPACDPPRAS